MVYLETGSNTITVTPQEKVTIANPEFVFVYVNDNTGKKVACNAGTETSLDHGRSQFTTIIGVDDNVNGKILLDDYGFYHYYIYQTADATTFSYSTIDSTDLRTLTGLVETGKAYWQPPTVTNNYNKDIRTSIKTYGQ